MALSFRRTTLTLVPVPIRRTFLEETIMPTPATFSGFQEPSTARPADSPRSADIGADAQKTRTVSAAERELMIRAEAHRRFELRGCEHGHDVEDWVAAEAEVDRDLAKVAAGSGTKEAFTGNLERQLGEWDARLGQLKADARKVAADLRVEYERQLAVLGVKRAEAEQKLKELRHRTEGAWEDLKNGAEKGWEEMRKALDSVAERFK